METLLVALTFFTGMTAAFAVGAVAIFSLTGRRQRKH